MPGMFRASRPTRFANQNEEIGLAQSALLFDKLADGMMLTGHHLVAPQLPALLITADAQPGDTTTTVTLTVGAPSIVSTVDTIGDQDFFKVTLEAGQTYEFGMYAKTGGPNLVPLTDAYVEIYDAAGTLLVSGDGGASTLLNNLNSGFDVLLTFTPESAGTFYINARAYDQDPTNGTTGDFVGDYEIFVREAAPGGYRPFYDADNPLYSLDWGTQVDGSSRNPDGEEGPRVTGNPFTGYAYNPYGIEGKTVITYYFARQGELFIDEDPTTPGTTDTMIANGFADWEKSAYLGAFKAFSDVADIVYVEVQNKNEADFTLITYNGTPGPGVSLLGRMSPPDEENEGRTEFNAADERWTEEGLAQGGFTFVTLIHELGHGHGMAHPHDNGGRSGIMRGVEADGVAFNYTMGDYDLNQGVHTMMSYQDGWQTSPYGSAETTDGFGWLGGLMAFDIAVIQDKYGVNEDTNAGNDNYVLKDENAAGTFYYSIWDADGIDSISYNGSRGANIDLRAASLQYEYGGGGWMSYAYGVFGGFTIANSVTIENAYGGWGADVLIGNDANNIFNGRGGLDVMKGGKGNDTFYIDDTANDQVIELNGEGQDTVYTAVTYILSNNAYVETLSTNNHAATGAINLTGNHMNNTIIGNAGANAIHGRGGTDTLIGLGGNDVYYTDIAATQAWESAGGGNDALYTSVSYTLAGGSEIEVLSTNTHGATAAINLTGNATAQTIFGNAGANTLDGKGGNDYLQAFGGADTFAFTTALGAGNVDTIAGFSTVDDVIVLDDAVFAGVGSLGALGASAFHTGAAAADAGDRIVYNSATGQLFFDADGAGGGAAVQFATLQAGLALSASDFQVI